VPHAIRIVPSATPDNDDFVPIGGGSPPHIARRIPRGRRRIRAGQAYRAVVSLFLAAPGIPRRRLHPFRPQRKGRTSPTRDAA
jgi:hypothetical protein